MHQDEDDAPDISDRKDDKIKFFCPKCQKKFSQKKNQVRHTDFYCKKELGGQDDLTLTSPRVSPVPQVPVTELKVDQECDGLLANVEGDYSRWRLSQVLGVTQHSTYPILFNYRVPGANTSCLSTCCPTTDPQSVMLSVLLDARANHDVEQIAMPKNVVVIHPNGSKVNVSKWLMPLNSGMERSNRPKIVVEDTDDSFIYSLGDRNSCDTADEDLEESLNKKRKFSPTLKCLSLQLGEGGEHPE